MSLFITVIVVTGPKNKQDDYFEPDLKRIY